MIRRVVLGLVLFAASGIVVASVSRVWQNYLWHAARLCPDQSNVCDPLAAEELSELWIEHLGAWVVLTFLLLGAVLLVRAVVGRLRVGLIEH